MIDQLTLEQLVLDVCHTMLGLPIKPAIGEAKTPPTLLASIQISGENCWIVEVEASPESACLIAAAMFGKPTVDVSVEDVRDALGELVNIIGGNAKGVLCTNADLSLPCVEMHEATRGSRTIGPASTVQATINGASLLVRFRVRDIFCTVV